MMSRLKRKIGIGFIGLFFAVLSADLWATKIQPNYEYLVTYDVELQPRKDRAIVKIIIPDASALTHLRFRIDPDIHSHIRANGSLKLDQEFANWKPPKKNARLSLHVQISNERRPGKYDALMTDDWAIFRGDDLVPSVKVKSKRGALSKSYLTFKLPRGWHTVNTGWERDKTVRPGLKQKNALNFFIDNPERKFDRPTGWMIAGKVSTRRAWVGDTRISISAPNGSNFHRMDKLTFLNFVWPEFENAFGMGPEKILVVGAGDPMWRGGLSASNSFYMHADRPIVSENGTSTLLHELVHMYTRIKGAKGDDWIAEGLAEYYAIELLHRAGGMDDERREVAYKKLTRWSKKVKNVRGKNSSGATTAKAVLIFSRLDNEIQGVTKSRKSLDNLVRKLQKTRTISYEHLQSQCQALIKRPCRSIKNIK